MRSRGRRARGAASVEAVALLPMFAVLLAGAMHLYRLGASHQEATARSRACAWAHALAGCPDSPPALCNGGQAGRKSASDQGVEEELADVEGFDDFTNKLGFLSFFLEGFFGESFATRRDAEVPALMEPDEQVGVSARTVLLCNPRPPKFDDFLPDIFDARNKIAGR